eukprot:XP_019923714.1 PREDICTED: uncharacterized protein LOC109619017 [Crassostrea gigas]
MIIKYLILCPEQDMCLGPMFKRNYTFTEKPACTPCECDDSCVRRSTCCPSKFYRQTDTPDFIEYQQNVNVKENETVMSCMEPLWNPEGIRSRKSYWVVETCPNNVKCISSPSKNITNSIPVTSLTTNQTYLNVQCALCNQEDITKLVVWEKKKFCTIRSALFSNKDIATLYKSVFSVTPVCNIGFHPSSSLHDSVKQCVEYTNDGNCIESIIPRNRMGAYLKRACKDFYIPYFSEEIVYKNIYCALCERVITDLPIQITLQGLHNNADLLPTPFSALIDFQQISDEPIQNSLECATNQIKDNKMNMCLDIQCEVEYVYHNQSCSLVHQMVNENNYEINLMIYHVHENDLPPLDIYSIGIVNALRDVMKENNLEDFLCRITVLGPSEPFGFYMAVVIELSINYLHNINQMIKHLLNIFKRYHVLEIPILYPMDKIVNISLSLVGQSFHVYGNSLFEKYFEHRLFVNPMSGKEMKVHQSFSMVNYGNAKQRPNCLRGGMMSIVADWYLCPKVKINAADTRIDVSNFSVCLVDYEICLASNYFKESLDKRSVLICLYQFLHSVKFVNNNLKLRSSDDLMASLSLVCLSLSSLGALATISTFFVSGSCSRIADVNIIVLAVFIILANTAHIVSKYFVWSQTLCTGVGMLVHFSWLSVICWMSLSFFQIFQTFTSFRISKVKVISKISYCLIVNIIICSSMVAINVTVSYVRSNGENLGYSLQTCYIADSDMIMYTFALPIGSFMVINIFMFLVTSIKFFKKINVQKSKDDRKFGAYFRLSTITGATWMFAFLAQFTGFQLFEIVHTVLSGGQGLFLYLAFGISLTTKHIHNNHGRDMKYSTQTASQK